MSTNLPLPPPIPDPPSHQPTLADLSHLITAVRAYVRGQELSAVDEKFLRLGPCLLNPRRRGCEGAERRDEEKRREEQEPMIILA